MALRERIAGAASRVTAALFGRRPGATAALEAYRSEEILDLPLRRESATERAAREDLMMSPAAGMIDSDDYQFRRISTGSKFKKRDLTPMQQDRMLEIAWFLWEQNPFARRLLTAMTDIVVGEGLGFDAEDPKILEAGLKVWSHPINRLGDRARELHNALALNGELVLPVAVNDVTGVPTIGFIDPYQIERVDSRPDNVLVPEFVVLKRTPDQTENTRIKVIQENPLTGKLEGECFYFAINKLPNSSRGRSDFLPLADWLDLFDQYMFAEVERVRLLSAFVWDLTINDGTPDNIAKRLGEIGTPQSGSVFGHNQSETLTPQSPALNATDRSETAKLLTIHIAGSLGMPITWFGWPDSNRATIEGQNDVAMKTPAARQKEFGGLLNQIIRFGIEQQRGLNPVLFKNLTADTFGVTMPEIAAKDISRVGAAIAQVIAGFDTALNNRTISRRVATVVTLAITKHLGSGFDFKAEDVMKDADAEAEERQAELDDQMAAAAKLAPKPAAGPTGRGNPPVPRAPREAETEDPPAWIGPGAEMFERVEEMAERLGDLERRPAPQPVTVNAPVTVHTPAVSVAPATVDVDVAAPHLETHVHPAPRAATVRTLEHDTDRDSPTFGQVKRIRETPAAEDGQ